MHDENMTVTKQEPVRTQESYSQNYIIIWQSDHKSHTEGIPEPGQLSDSNNSLFWEQQNKNWIIGGSASVMKVLVLVGKFELTNLSQDIIVRDVLPW